MASLKLVINKEYYFLNEKRKSLVDLWNNSAYQTIFNRPEWFESIFLSYKKNKTYYYLEVWKGDEIVGFWPFWIYREGYKDLWVKKLEPIAAMMTDQLSPIIKRELVIETLGLMCDGINELSRSAGIVKIPHLIIGDEQVGIIVDRLRDSGKQVYQGQSVCPLLRFESDARATELLWSQRHRKDIKRQLRKMGEIGELKLFVASSKEEIVDKMSALIEFHKNKWGAEGHTSQFLQNEVTSFYYNLIKAMPFEFLIYSELLCGDKIVSSELGFTDDWLRCYSGTFDTDFAYYSPGKIHTRLLIDYALDKGLKGIDFLQGDERYKYHWTDKHQVTPLIIAFKSKYSLHYIWQTKLKKIAKAIFLSIKLPLKKFAVRLTRR